MSRPLKYKLDGPPCGGGVGGGVDGGDGGVGGGAFPITCPPTLASQTSITSLAGCIDKSCI